MRGTKALSLYTGCMEDFETPRIATSGALMIGVKAVPPIPPRLEIVKQPPCISDSSPSARASSNTSFLSASRITGTIRPLGVSAAKPTWQYCLSTRFSAVASSEALNRGSCLSTRTQALMMKASGVRRTPSATARALSQRRASSSSVISA